MFDPRSPPCVFPTLLVAFGAAAFVACDEKKESAPLATAERSQIVQRKQNSTEASPAPSSVPAATSAAPKPRKALCGGKLDDGTKSVPKRPALSRRAAAGEPELAQEPGFGSGFTWVNFWAAWCGPCKEEIPRLVGWQDKLSAAGTPFRVVFVSLDDDERQLEKFLADQPPGGLRATYWLEEGKQRDEWLAGAGVAQDPELPVHLLVDAQGKIRCRVQGAVEDADYPDLVRLLGG